MSVVAVADGMTPAALLAAVERAGMPAAQVWPVEVFETGRGTVVVAGAPTARAGDWLVAGVPVRDPWGVPSGDVGEVAEAVAAAFDRYGPAAVQLAAGPFVAVDLGYGTVVRAVNGIVPMYVARQGSWVASTSAAVVEALTGDGAAEAVAPGGSMPPSREVATWGPIPADPAGGDVPWAWVDRTVGERVAGLGPLSPFPGEADVWCTAGGHALYLPRLADSRRGGPDPASPVRRPPSELGTPPVVEGPSRRTVAVRPRLRAPCPRRHRHAPVRASRPPRAPIVKVLHVFKDLFPPLAAGITCYVHDVAGETVRRGHQVEVQVAGAGAPREVLPNGVSVRRHWELARMLSMPLAPGLVTGPRRADVDVIHVHMPNPIGELGPFLNKHRAPIVASFHARLGRQRFLEPIYGPFRTALLGRAAAVLVSSEAMARSSELAPVSDKVVVLPYGVSPRMVACEPRPVADVDTLRLLYVGRLVYYKGLDVLLRAVAATPGPRPRLTVVGDGPLRASLVQLAAGLDLDGDVDFRGSVGDDELRRAYAEHDVFVLPSVSRAEAFGLAMAEAMTNGMPVVSTELDTGTSWVNEDGVSGLVVPPGDVAALTGALERLRPAAVRAPLAAGARDRARALFDFEVHCDRLMEIYERAAATRR